MKSPSSPVNLEAQQPNAGDATSRPGGADKVASVWPKRLVLAFVLLTVAGFLALGIVRPTILFLLALLAASVLVFHQWIRWRAVAL